ncbi:unnamed protein product [Trichobilharzia szidati]|nr:unnamed protein product [Trichobilharzia szidati]
MLLQQYQEQQRQLQQQQLQQLTHHSLALSSSPRVQRRPASFYLSRSIDEFIKHLIPEPGEEEGQDDEKDEEEEEEDYEKGEEGCKKEKKEHFNSHRKRIHEKLEQKI